MEIRIPMLIITTSTPRNRLLCLFRRRGFVLCLSSNSCFLAGEVKLCNFQSLAPTTLMGFIKFVWQLEFRDYLVIFFEVWIFMLIDQI